jgi:hypothetical protein
MFHGFPRSARRPTMAMRYPRKAVRIAGRWTAWYSWRLRISTAAPMVNPPAASAIPHIMSNPIQSPQGWVWERFVVLPSPAAKRYTSTASPTAQMAAATAFVGVSSERTYSRKLIPSRTFSRHQERNDGRRGAAAFNSESCC